MVDVAIQIGIAIISAIATSVVTKILTPSRKGEQQEYDVGQELDRQLDNNYPRQVAVGYAMIGGSGAFGDSYSEKNEKGVRVTILSDYEITAFLGLWLDGEKVTLGGSAFANKYPITSHFTGKNGETRAWITVHKGTETQAADPTLLAAFPNKFGVNDRFAGCAYAVLEAENTADDENDVPWRGGFPQMRLLVKGAPIYDPREVSHDIDDPDTWEWTQNEELIWAQHKIGFKRAGEVVVGASYPPDLLDWDKIELNADVCDALALEDVGDLTSPRFGGLLTSGKEKSDEVLIRDCYNADLVESGGVLYTIPAGPKIVSQNVDFQAVGGYVARFTLDGEATDKYNDTLTKYSEPLNNYVLTSAPSYHPSTYLTEDKGNHRPLEQSLHFCLNRRRAMRIQKRDLEATRDGMGATFNMPYRYWYTITAGDVFTVTNTGWPELNGKIFECIKKQRAVSEGEGVRVIMQVIVYNPAIEDFDPLIDDTTALPVLRPPRAWPFYEPVPFAGSGQVDAVNATVDAIVIGVSEIDQTLNNPTTGLVVRVQTLET